MRKLPFQRTTWPQIIAVEPCLERLVAEAEIAGACDWHEHEEFKSRLRRLVGWYAEKPILRNECAYFEVIQKLTEALAL
jgi:hypothetical protein